MKPFDLLLQEELARIQTLRAQETYTYGVSIRRWYNRMRSKRVLRRFQSSESVLSVLSRAIASFML